MEEIRARIQPVQRLKCCTLSRAREVLILHLFRLGKKGWLGLCLAGEGVYGVSSEGQARELSCLAQNTNAALIASKGPAGVVVVALQLPRVVLHLTPPQDCFWLVLGSSLGDISGSFVWEASFTTAKELLNTIDL